MLMILFSVNLDWLPASGVDSWKGWIMPVFCATIYPIATIMRTTRASMLEVIRQDYIRTARSKGIAENKVIMRHALKNAIIPVVTLIGLMLGMILGGIIVLEAVFSIPGLGMLLRNAIATKDTPIIVGTVLFASFMMCAVNLIVDIFYAFIDPRIKAQYTSGKKHTAKKIAL
jgi:peptide/nickel transport system permease protein